MAVASSYKRGRGWSVYPNRDLITNCPRQSGVRVLSYGAAILRYTSGQYANVLGTTVSGLSALASLAPRVVGCYRRPCRRSLRSRLLCTVASGYYRFGARCARASNVLSTAHKTLKNRASGVAHQNSLTVLHCLLHQKCAVYFGP